MTLKLYSLDLRAYLIAILKTLFNIMVTNESKVKCTVSARAFYSTGSHEMERAKGCASNDL